ncbi:DoxX family protein [Myroides pelagicus]|uniref:DoxX family protein n=1 Tax=Myroides pelagicus TaxID=270914 RepID=A0A7K1GNX7_9FLAO|nr:DoxX family protein [Myroides pelagicus]MTH29914.1 DoxX family protein [Myroides pelagicus]
MNKQKIAFWVSTVLFSVFMLFSAYNYIASEEMKQAFVHLGFPDYFRVELAVAKAIGSVVLLLPMLPRTLRGFAYAGFVINIVSAAVAHLAIGEPVSSLGFVLIAAILLTISYFSAFCPCAKKC